MALWGQKLGPEPCLAEEKIPSWDGQGQWPVGCLRALGVQFCNLDVTADTCLKICKDGISSCSEWHFVQVEASDEWCPPGFCLGTGALQDHHQ